MHKLKKDLSWIIRIIGSGLHAIGLEETIDSAKFRPKSQIFAHTAELYRIDQKLPESKFRSRGKLRNVEETRFTCKKVRKATYESKIRAKT